MLLTILLQILPAVSHKTWDAGGAVTIDLNFSSYMAPESIPTMFRKTMEEFPDHKSMAVKRDNKWM